MSETMTSERPLEASPLLNAGREAAARYAWGEAYDMLSAAGAEAPLSAPDLEHLAEAAWWTGRLPACLDALERAYAAHLKQENGARAGVVALELSRHYMHKLSPALAAGWFSRAERLLQDQPDSREHGYLLLALLSRGLGMVSSRRSDPRGELDRALELARQTFETGCRSGDRDLQALALHNEGYVRVLKGEVEEGLVLIDEAAAAAVGGELGAKATAVIYCNTISACRDLADYRRAGEWTEAATRWCERQSITGFPGVCRIHRAEMMRLRGAWAAAEQEVRRACDELQDFALDVAGEGFHELGEIRLRMGDLAGAEEAFSQAHELGREPLPGLALLRLAQGDLQRATSCLRLALAEESSDRLTRARLLPAQVEVAIAAGDLDTARSAADELEQICEVYRSPALAATALIAKGAVQLVEGSAEEALRTLRRALQLWREVDAPYEIALTRRQMGEAYLAQGESDAALRELQAARAAFQRLGATLDERRTSQLLEGLGESTAARASRGRREVRTFMFTDIEKSTNLVEVIGDDAWEDLLRWHDQTLRSLFAAHGGEEINRTGDGFFVGFRESPQALECAVAIQRTLAEHRRGHGFSPQVRIGIHAAEAARLGQDYGGKGVHEAARIAALAGGGEIVASRDTVAAGACRYPVSEPRTVTLKGFSEAARVVTIDWR
jgi:class 3 adenylate cyclase